MSFESSLIEGWEVLPKSVYIAAQHIFILCTRNCDQRNLFSSLF